MKNVTVSIQITINLTADDWHLYTSKPGIQNIMRSLNEGVERAVNQAATPGEAFNQASQVLRIYRSFGALDTAAIEVLNELIRLRFPGQW